MRIAIDRARPEQAPRLSEIAWAAKRHWGYPEHVLERWREELTLDADFVRDRAVHVATFDGASVGLYALHGSGDTLELEHFWVAPDWMGHGIGRRLLVHAVEQARELGATAIEIDSDPHAEGFYVKMGAVLIGRTPAPTVEDDRRFLPRLRLELV